MNKFSRINIQKWDVNRKNLFGKLAKLCLCYQKEENLLFNLTMNDLRFLPSHFIQICYLKLI